MAAHPSAALPSCANTTRAVDGKLLPCPDNASNVCRGCFLVQVGPRLILTAEFDTDGVDIKYCSRDCQVAHWSVHKNDCKSPLMKSTWKPGWHRENRQPQFVTSDDVTTGFTSFGNKKFLFGNMPALNMLDLAQNEGVDVSHNFRLLFAASGDLRNVVKTLAALPTTYPGQCEVVINDRDFDIVARNAILLLTALHFGADSAPSMMLHLWYSAFIPGQMLRDIQERIRPLVQEVCGEIEAKDAATAHTKKWTCGTSSLRLVLKKAEWNQLLSYLEVPEGLSNTQARAIRTAITLAPARKDYVDRVLYTLPPARRVGTMKFREDGILLPFGSSREDFYIPNPTLFQTKDSWPMADAADPLDDWSMREILQKTPAKNDTYGGLYLLVQDTLRQFCERIKKLKINFELLQVDALKLPNLINESEHSFDRIELSNIADIGWVGPAAALTTFGTLLKRPSQNPHATLLTLFLNAVHETSSDADGTVSLREELSRMRLYIRPTLEVGVSNKFNATFARFIDARRIFRDFDKPFDHYMREFHFEDIGLAAGLEMCSAHTIVSPWPFRLRQNATQREFDVLHASGLIGSERYVEWKSVV